MLTHIQIRDFAIIDTVELELGPGLTVLTGETGAGKSILVDALMVATGGRTGSEVVRHGAERAEVTATFSLADNAAARAWFESQSLDCDDECVVRRVVTGDGRSRAYVNGQTTAIQALRQLGETLLDVHGQMEYQSLMKRAAQRQLLDTFGNHSDLVGATNSAWRNLKALRSQRDDALASSQDRFARLELLRYHVAELKALDLKIGEVAELGTERQRVAQSGRLALGTHEMLHILAEAEGSSADLAITKALQSARTLGAIDTRLRPIAKLLDESLIAVREATESLRHYQSALDVDPARQEWLEQRLAALESVARKHRIEPTELPPLQERLNVELVQLENIGITLDGMEAALKKAEQVYLEQAQQLSAARRATAAKLSAQVSSLMQGLGMPGGRFQIDISTRDEAGEQGLDDIEFMVSANPGQPPQPLAKVASGGELSRISLAVQVAAVASVQQPCLVFDEVDAGVGGGVAEIVGRQLRALSEANATKTQVLCVTHLPQVASQAHAHVRVTKLTDGKTTRTALHRLNQSERVEEIARMLGGLSITDTAREHAAEMLRATASASALASGASRSSNRRAKKPA
ncbi:MAG: DNA repair protein RecN [Candidatus Obscuribacterales bacterium]|nr:DNA repair protein RecN [Steroidobacteraceae bacterium]